MKKLLAYHGKQSIKDDLIVQLEAHYEADEIISGIYWANGKGCAVGCTVHSGNHADYEPMYGIPQILAHLEDAIFESLPKIRQKKWPLKFAKAINVGADLSLVWPKFAVFLLTDKIHGIIQYAKTEDQRKAIQKVSDLYSSNGFITLDQWIQERNTIYSHAPPADAPHIAPSYGAHIARADAAHVARADAAHIAPSYAADAANAAAHYIALHGDIRQKYRIVQSEKLLQLLSECR
jgi:hypothetical protein